MTERTHARRKKTDRREQSARTRTESAQAENGVPPIVQAVLQASGQPLDTATRTFMEPRFGHDFSQVRVHTDERAEDSARALGARAYTVESDIVFGAAQYAPGTEAGQQLLAHELTHVVQQSQGTAIHRKAEEDQLDREDAAAGSEEMAEEPEDKESEAAAASAEQIPPAAELEDDEALEEVEDEEEDSAARINAKAAAPEAASPLVVPQNDPSEIEAEVVSHTILTHSTVDRPLPIRPYPSSTGGIVQRQSAPAAAPTASTTAPTGAVSEEDQHEFDLLKSKIQDRTAAAYVAHRDKFFGSRDAYLAFASDSDNELDSQKGLRKSLELTGEAQTVFYRWVRKAYLNAGVTDVPGLIRRGMTPQTRQAMDRVRSAYGQDFQHGGFNPRPKKGSGKYRLGTLSEHAMGRAVDIESSSNPALTVGDWAFIQKLAGKTVNRSPSRWKTEEEAYALWQEITELNNLFVTNADAEIRRVTNEQAAQAGKANAAPSGRRKRKPPKPLNVVFRGHRSLIDWRGGFFTLDWRLVNELRLAGFYWGALFKSPVDLHHFELIPPRPQRKKKQGSGSNQAR